MQIQLQDDAWEDVDEGVEALLDEWHVKEGDNVVEGQLVANVMIIKTNFDITAPAAGTITQLLIKAQSNFSKGQALAELKTA